jgi:hypothetical protein
MKDNRTVLFVNDLGIANDNKLRKETLDAARELVKLTTDCGVLIDDLTDYFVSPIEYTYLAYYEANKDKLPAAISPSKSLIFTSWDNARAEVLLQTFRKKAGQVTITKNEITSSLNLDLYTYYLNEDLREYYELVLQYIDLFNKIETFGIMRAGLAAKSVDGLKFEGLKVIIDFNYFRAKQ